jgi:cell division transport system permease protein
MISFRLAIQNSFRNFWLSLTSVFIMFLMLFSLSLVYGFSVAGQRVIDSFKEKMDLGIYLKPNSGADQIDLLKTAIENTNKVKSVVYLSPDDSLQNFEKKHQNDPLILKSLEELKENPFGGVLIIKFYNPSDYPKIISVIDQSEYQDLIQSQDFYDYENLIQSFDKLSQKIYLAGIIVSGFLALIAILVVFTTIKLAAFSRKKEIRIMRLVGASNWTIRGPFLIESFLYALISWILAIAATLCLSYFSTLKLQNFLELDFDIFNYFKTQAIYFWLGLFVFSLFVSLVSSVLALKKHLKA